MIVSILATISISSANCSVLKTKHDVLKPVSNDDDDHDDANSDINDKKMYRPDGRHDIRPFL